jgi:hypothetical protein
MFTTTSVICKFRAPQRRVQINAVVAKWWPRRRGFTSSIACPAGRHGVTIRVLGPFSDTGRQHCASRGHLGATGPTRLARVAVRIARFGGSLVQPSASSNATRPSMLIASVLSFSGNFSLPGYTTKTRSGLRSAQAIWKPFSNFGAMLRLISMAHR